MTETGLLPAEVPDWFYMWNVKEAVAHRAFAGRPTGPRLVLPAERDGWVKEQAETLITGLRESGFDIIGDAGDLRPQPAGILERGTGDRRPPHGLHRQPTRERVGRPGR